MEIELRRGRDDRWPIRGRRTGVDFVGNRRRGTRLLSQEQSIMNRHLSWILFAAVAGAPAALQSTGRAATVEWLRQFGTATSEHAWGVALDGAGNVFAVGTTSGGLGGANVGRPDAYVTKFNAQGALLWSRQLGGQGDTSGFSVATDGLGNVFICGETQESLDGMHAGGLFDAFVSKFDGAGNHAWTRQLGSSRTDSAQGVAVDPRGSVYVTGITRGSLATPTPGEFDGFLWKLNSDGSSAWIRQLGTPRTETATAVAIDGQGHVYVTGMTTGNFGGQNPAPNLNDPFLSKYDSEGSALWTRQLETTLRDTGFGVSADALGNVFIAGYVDDESGAGNAFVSRFDAAGQFYWTRYDEVHGDETYRGVAADGKGHAYAAGSVRGGSPQLSDSNRNVGVLTAKYDIDGELLWSHEIDSVRGDMAFGVATTGDGTVHIAGTTYGDLNGPNLGGARADAFVARLVEGQPSDFNGDGVVDGQDFLLWQRGETPAPLSMNDLADWRSNYGRGVAPVAAIPEPDAVLLGVLVLAPFGGWRGR
jgi:hypothetical protein